MSAHAALPPRPDLRSDQIEHRNIQQIQVTCQAEVKIRTVGEDGRVGRMRAKLTNQAAVVAVDAGKVTDNLRESDDGKPGRVEHGLDAGLLEVADRYNQNRSSDRSVFPEREQVWLRTCRRTPHQRKPECARLPQV